MKLIRKIIFVFVIIISISIANTKSNSKKNASEEAIDLDLIFLEKLYTLDTSIKSESKNQEITEKSGFEEFENPLTQVNNKEDSINSNHEDQDTLKEENEDKFTVGTNSGEDLIGAENDTFEDQKDKKNEESFNDEENKFMELRAKKTENTNSAEFYKNQLDEINKFEVFLLDQEKELEMKARYLLDKTKSFLK